MLKVPLLIHNFRNSFKLFRKLIIPKNARCMDCQTLTFPTSSHLFVCKRQISISNVKFMVKKKTKIFDKIKPKEKTVKVWHSMTVADLAKSCNRSLDDVFEAMIYVNNTERYDEKNSKLDNLNIIHEIVKKLGYRCQIIKSPGSEKSTDSQTNKDAVKRPPADSKEMVKRSPVVTIMGHVDHGKTTLLDSLRKTSVVKEEFGGITQHIGAFSVKLPSGSSITFLDTPGHAAFSAMRSRGAHATDIVVLVVAADDGVMEQTVESIKFANDAKVPIIVAINKIDKPKIDIEHTKKGLIANGVQLEDMGGEVQAVEISAATGKNLPQLLESILTLAEVLEIKADPKGLVEGVVLESKMDKGRGKMATILVQRGTLQRGNFIVAGLAWGKVRSMFDEWGKPLQSVSPGMPAQVIGWKELPAAGDILLEVENEKRVKEVIDYRQEKEMEEKQKADLPEIQKRLEEHLITYKADLEERKSIGRLRRKKRIIHRPKEIVESDHPKLEIVIKGDVDGSVEAIMDIIDTYHSHDACELDIIYYGVGEVTETDIELAETFNGIVYAFNVRVSTSILKLAEDKKVEIKDFNVIYKLIDSLKEDISNKLPPLDKEEVLGEANVLQEFIVTEGKKKVPVAGCRCTKGILKRNALFRLIRGDEIIHEGPLESMRHIKNEVESIKKEVECGLRLRDQNIRFQNNDTLICYEIVQVDQKTDWDPGF